MILVDDQPSLRELARLNLRLAGLDVVAEAGDTDAAVAALAVHAPDVVVLDVDMPGRTGIDALPDLLAASPRSQVVVWSSVGRSYVEDAARRGGAAAFVSKTEDIDALVRAVCDLASRAAG